MMRTLGFYILIAAGQMPAPQPTMKLGLWELSGTVTPAAPGAPAHLEKLGICLTSSSNDWIARLAAPKASGCKPSNVTSTAGVRSMDVTCPNITAHVVTGVFSPESARLTTQATVTLQGHPTAFKDIINLHFLDTSCGDIKPGMPQPLS